MATALPTRMHHRAYVVRDQEETRRFYEGVLGMPLVATWAEEGVIGGARRAYCHTFYGLADGSALAFFQFADPDAYESFRAQAPPSPFDHIALAMEAEAQDRLAERLDEAGLRYRITDHGYCRSLYIVDPDGLRLEFTVDTIDAADAADRRDRARADLERWLAGDHTPNNELRH